MIKLLSRAALLVLFPLLVAECKEQTPVPKSGWTTLSNFVQQGFFSSRSSGSLILRGTCETTQQGRVVVSDKISDPPWGLIGNLPEALAFLSHEDPNLTWTVDADGHLRVGDKRVSADLLLVRLKRVVFVHDGDPTAAIRDVLAAPEIRTYLKEKHIEEGTAFDNIVPASTKGFPRLSDVLTDVTVEQALNRAMKFFPGLWIYSECESDSLRRFSIRGVEVGPNRRP